MKFIIAALALVAITQANVIFRKLDVNQRIVGGSEATPHAFPYQALLLTKDGTGNTFQCGGSLLTTTRILTAAHCVYGIVAATIVLGAHDISAQEASWQIRPASAFRIHGGYNPKTIQNDIAIVEFIKPAQLNEYVQLTLLPDNTDDSTYEGHMATVSGWGLVADGGSTAKVLRFVSIPVVSNDECSEDYGYISDSQICTQGDNHKSSCQGDSGGPLVVGSDNMQVGIVSFGRSEGCEKGFDAVYTRVTSYLPWILANM